MSERNTISLQRRLQALRSIPDNHRTDEQWDELNELEIALAPVNRIASPSERPVRPADGKLVPENPNYRRRKPLKRIHKKPMDPGGAPD